MPAGTLDPHRLAVLADALEEAGCTDPDILGHLRDPGPHYRGCHVLDLILGRLRNPVPTQIVAPKDAPAPPATDLCETPPDKDDSDGGVTQDFCDLPDDSDPITTTTAVTPSKQAVPSPGRERSPRRKRTERRHASVPLLGWRVIVADGGPGCGAHGYEGRKIDA